MKKTKRIILSAIIAVVSLFCLIIPIVTAVVYECVFSDRFETAPWHRYEVSDFEGLLVERSDFYTDGGVTLAGYKYFREETEPKGVVVISHGYGGGGHNIYMPYIDKFCRGGYFVFAYDAKGTDNSGGKAVGGLPEGVINLDFALHHIISEEEYEGLPVVLFGHSWGAYSAGSILYMHPEIKAAILIAGFNESADLIYHRGKAFAGKGAKLLLPYVDLYERIKFGKEFSSANVICGLQKSEAGVMIVHSVDDGVVPTEYGYDKFYEFFGDDGRFEFVLYENKGHDYILYSKDAADYRDKLNEEYRVFVEEGGREYSAEVKTEFMEKNLDKKKCFEPDADLVKRIIDLYDKYCIEK